MKIFMTGGGGFIGSHLAKRLIELGHEVTNFGRGTYPNLESMGVRCIKGDLSQKDRLSEAMKNHELCFHVAAKVAMWGKWEDFYQTNVIGTQNIIEGCKNNGIKKLIYTSSPSVIFGKESLQNVNENVPYPQDHLGLYGKSKAIAEQNVLKANDDSLATLSLRPHLVFGPGDQNLIPRLIEARKKNRLKIVGDGNNQVDVLYVSNAVDAHIKAMENLNTNSKVSGKAYFIGQGPVKLWDFVNQILAKKDLPPVTKKISFNKAYKVGWIIEKCLKIFRVFNYHPPMTRFVALQLSKDHYYSHKNAEELLGWSPKVSIEEALNQI